MSSHIAQKIDQIVSLNSSVLGSISWLSLISEHPLRIKNCFIRPGIMDGTTRMKFATLRKEVSFIKGSGHITFAAGKHQVLLDDAHTFIKQIVDYEEQNLNDTFKASPGRRPKDLMGVADLDTSNSRPNLTSS